MKVNLTLLLKELKERKSQRTQSSLDKLNELLKAHSGAGEKDFSIATIGRLSAMKGGIGSVSIRNKSGGHYRRLIEAWAVNASCTMKKPPNLNSRERDIPTDNKLLERLDDPALRVLFGQIIAEGKKLKKENRLLKQQVDIVIDLRPTKVMPYRPSTPQESIEIITPLHGKLLPSEIEALESAISEDFFNSQGWDINEKAGRVKDQHGRPLYKPGYINAIKKVLSEVD